MLIVALHVVFGTCALALGPLALFARKGRVRHRVAGFAFGVAMLAVLSTAAFMWQAKGHLFLVPLGIVCGYLAFCGIRVIARRRRRIPSGLHDAIDVCAALLAIAAGIASAMLGFDRVSAFSRSISPALIGIGTIACAFGLNELLGFASRRTKLGWLYAHLSAMLATYISAVTAFFVINAHTVPMALRWFLPSAIGGTVIVAWVLRYAVAPATPRFILTRLSLPKSLLFGRKTGSGRTLKSP